MCRTLIWPEVYRCTQYTSTTMPTSSDIFGLRWRWRWWSYLVHSYALEFPFFIHDACTRIDFAVTSFAWCVSMMTTVCTIAILNKRIPFDSKKCLCPLSPNNQHHVIASTCACGAEPMQCCRMPKNKYILLVEYTWTWTWLPYISYLKRFPKWI